MNNPAEHLARTTPLDKTPNVDLGSELIPKQRYISKDFAQLEWDKMWTKVWTNAGLVADIPNPGDYFCYELGGESIIIARQDDGSIAAFYNVCSHRAMRVVPEGSSGQLACFTCPFHGWQYGRDGSIAKITDANTFTQGLKVKELGLKPLRCEQWGGFVWVNMNEDCETLHEFLDVLPAHLEPYDFAAATPIYDVTVEVDCNWKTCLDGFAEAYHVQQTHPGLMRYSDDVNVQYDLYNKHSRMIYKLGLVSPRLQQQEITQELRDMCLRPSGIDPDNYQGGLEDMRDQLVKSVRGTLSEMTGANYDRLHDTQCIDDFHYMIFPNLVLNIHGSGFMFFRMRPNINNPDRMLFDYQFLYRGPKLGLERAKHRYGILREGFSFSDFDGGDVLDEDFANLPLVQSGMHSKSFSGLLLNQQEIRIRNFHRILESYVNDSGIM